MISMPRAARQAARGLEHARSVQRLAERDLRPEHREQALVVPRLLDEVLRAAAHRLDRDADRAPGRHHDDRRVRVERADPRDRIETLVARRRVARVVQVHQHRIRRTRAQRADERLGVIERFGRVALAFQQQAERFGDVALIVSDKDSRGSGRHSLSLTRAVRCVDRR